jgi:F-type H+-transporting ATPase subunit a
MNMRVPRLILAVVLGVLLPAVGWAADGAHEGEAQSGLPNAAPVLFHLGPLPVTNSMVLTWVVALGLVLFAKVAMRNVQAVPKGLQNFWEWLVEGLYKFLEEIIGPHLVQKTFWFFGALFIFIVATNWFGLIPGVGTIGRGVMTDHGFHVTHPLFRGAHADFNMTFAISLVFFLLWTVWAIQENGVVGFFKHLFAPKGETTGALFLLMVVVFFAVGLLEVVSILFRPVSLSFRLYGNIFAGENMIESMTHLGGTYLGWLTALPFYFMELLVGMVQALVFMLLTAVFTLLICTHDESEGHGHAKGHSDH